MTRFALTLLKRWRILDAVLVVDETGFVKKGDHSVGVARQYSGAAGRIENSQIGVFLAYASRYGQTLIDRRLYLPEKWAADAPRRAAAAVPEEIDFATKPEMAREMIAANLDAGVMCAYVLGDAVYGSDSGLRHMLEKREQPYVLAVRSESFSARRRRFASRNDPRRTRRCPGAGRFRCHAAGEDAKGPRLNDWARVGLLWRKDPRFAHWLLVRRSRGKTPDRAYYLVFAPTEATLADLAGVAGLRWTVEECFERAKSDLGLDHCEALLLAWLASPYELVHGGAGVSRETLAQLRRAAWGKPNERSKPDNRRLIMRALVPSAPEIRYLLARLILNSPHGRRFVMPGRTGSRKHQLQATTAHYKRYAYPQL